MTIKAPKSSTKKHSKYNAKATKKLISTISEFYKRIDEIDNTQIPEFIEELKQVIDPLLKAGANPHSIDKDGASVIFLFVNACRRLDIKSDPKKVLRSVIDEFNLDVNQRSKYSTVFAIFLENITTDFNDLDKIVFDVLYDHEDFDIDTARAQNTDNPERNRVRTEQIVASSTKSDNTSKIALPVFIAELMASPNRTFDRKYKAFCIAKAKEEMLQVIPQLSQSQKLECLERRGLEEIKGDIFKKLKSNISEEAKLACENAAYDKYVSIDDYMALIKENVSDDSKVDQVFESTISERLPGFLSSEKSIKRYFDPLKVNLVQQLKSVETLEQFEVQNQAITDYTDIKMYGHKLGLGGKVNFETDKYADSVDLEGFNTNYTYPSVTESLQTFSDSEPMQRYLGTLPENEQEATKRAVLLAHQAFSSASVTVGKDVDKLNAWRGAAARYRDGKPVVFESIWTEHSATSILYKDRIYICNKGAGTSQASIKCYKIGNIAAILGDPPNLDSIQKKIKELSTTERTDRRWLGEMSGILPGSAAFSNHAMMEELQLTREKVIPIKGQVVGNCSYTNSKRGVDGLLVALEDRAALEKAQEEFSGNVPKEWNVKQEETLGINIDLVQRTKLYKAFGLHDRLKMVKEFCDRLDEIGKDKLDSTHKGYADVLFLTLKLQNDVKSERNVEVGRAIMSRLENLGYTHEEIYDHVQSLPQEYMFEAVVYCRYHESVNQSMSQERRERAGRELILATTKGGKDIKQKEFFQAIGLQDDRAKLTDQEKGIQATLDAKASDKRQLQLAVWKGAAIYFKELISSKINKLTGNKNKQQANIEVPDLQSLDDAEPDKTTGLKGLFERFKGISKAASKTIEADKPQPRTVKLSDIPATISKNLIKLKTKLNNSLSNLKMPQFKRRIVSPPENKADNTQQNELNGQGLDSPKQQGQKTTTQRKPQKRITHMLRKRKDEATALSSIAADLSTQKPEKHAEKTVDEPRSKKSSKKRI